MNWPEIAYSLASLAAGFFIGCAVTERAGRTSLDALADDIERVASKIGQSTNAAPTRGPKAKDAGPMTKGGLR